MELAANGRSQQRPQAPATPAKATRGARQTLERISARPLAGLGQLPTPVLPTILLALVLFGMLFPARWAGVALVTVALLLAWLTALSWPATSTSGRVVRVSVNLALLALGCLRIMGLVG
jgi:hypothetical protein